MTTMRLGLVLVIAFLGGCNSYVGDARSIRPDALRSEPGWVAVQDIQLVEQVAEYDCGAAALAMVLDHYEPNSAPTVMAWAQNRPMSAQELRDYARSRGHPAFVVEGGARDIAFELQRGRPTIVGMIKPTVAGPVAHYEVVIGIHPGSRRIATLDPALGWRQHSLAGFLEEWQGSGSVLLVVLPTTASEGPAHAVEPPPQLSTGPQPSGTH